MIRKRDREGDLEADATPSARLTPVDIQQVRFRVAMRGYDEREVDLFLDRITEELTHLIEEKAALAAGGTPGIGAATSDEFNRALESARADADRMRTDLERFRAESERLRAELDTAMRATEVARADDQVATAARDEAMHALEIQLASARSDAEQLRTELTAARDMAARESEDLLETARREAEELVERARIESAEIIRRAMVQAQSHAPATEGEVVAGARGDEVRMSMAPFLSREREFLQSLGSIVQAHAEEIRSMVTELRAQQDAARARDQRSNQPADDQRA